METLTSSERPVRPPWQKLDDAGSLTENPATENRKVLLAVAAPLALTLLLGALSDGAYHDDDLTHFLMARWAWRFPCYLLHVWGRPGLTMPLATVSWLPNSPTAWHAARALSALVTAATALIAARLAMRLGVRHGWWVVVACFAQPLVTVLACTTLSETYAAFYLIAAIALLVAKRPVWASLALSPAFLTRHEAVIFLPLWWLGLVRTKTSRPRRITAALLCLWAPLLHNVLYRWAFGQWPARIFTTPHGSHQYLPAGLLAYVPDAFYALSPAVLCLSVIGAVVLLRRRTILLPAFAAVFFATHLVIKALGVYASGGYARFMVTVAPFVAVMAAVGLEALTNRRSDQRSRAGKWAILAAVLAVGWIACELERRAGRLPALQGGWLWVIRATAALLILLAMATVLSRRVREAAMAGRFLLIALAMLSATQWLGTVRPLRLGPHQLLIRKAVAWMKTQGLTDAPLFATDPWFSYFLRLVENPRAYKGPALLASMPVGTVFVWDSLYSGNDFHCLPLDHFLKNDHYRLLREFGDGRRNRKEERAAFQLVLFRKVAPTPIPSRPPRPYPMPLVAGRQGVRGIYYLREHSHPMIRPSQKSGG